MFPEFRPRSLSNTTKKHVPKEPKRPESEIDHYFFHKCVVSKRKLCHETQRLNRSTSAIIATATNRR